MVQISGAPEYPGHVALRRGPQVLSLEKKSNPEVAYLFRAAPLSNQFAGNQVEGEYLGRDHKLHRGKLTFVPYMDSSEPFVWVKSPGNVSTSPASGDGLCRRTLVEERPGRRLDYG